MSQWRQIEALLVTHEDKRQKAAQKLSAPASTPAKVAGRTSARKPATAN